MNVKYMRAGAEVIPPRRLFLIRNAEFGMRNSECEIMVSGSAGGISIIRGFIGATLLFG